MNRRGSTNRRSRGYLSRRVNTRDPIQTFLIVCEGIETEPNYFKRFRVPSQTTKIVIFGLGDNTLSLVQRTMELKKKSKKQGGYDQVWCVLDRDIFPADRFNAALAMAEQHQINVAYSNESFELWYLLHFNYYDTGLARDDCSSKLSTLLGHTYEKNSKSMYEDLKGRQAIAIQNAQRLLTQYDPPNPEGDNPSTTVHLLVLELNRFQR